MLPQMAPPVRHPPSKIPTSCKTILSTKSKKVLTTGKYRSTLRNHEGLNCADSVTLDSVIRDTDSKK